MSSVDIHFMFSSLCESCWFIFFFRDPFLICLGRGFTLDRCENLNLVTNWTSVFWRLWLNHWQLFFFCCCWTLLSLFLVNIIWAFLPPTLSFKDGLSGGETNNLSLFTVTDATVQDGWSHQCWKYNILGKHYNLKKVLERVFFMHHIICFCSCMTGPTFQRWHPGRFVAVPAGILNPPVSYFANYTILNNFHRSSGSRCCRWQSLRSVCVQTFSPQMTERTWNTFGWEPEGRCSQRGLALTGRTQRDMTLCASLTDHLATGTQM